MQILLVAFVMDSICTEKSETKKGQRAQKKRYVVAIDIAD